MSDLSRESALLEIVYSLEKAFWDLLGDGAKATVSIIGEELYERLKSSTNIDLENVDEEEALKEISRILTEDMEIAKSVKINREGSKFIMLVDNCMMLEVQRHLMKNGIEPFLCPFLNLIAYITRRRGANSTSLGEIHVDIEKSMCLLTFDEIK